MDDDNIDHQISKVDMTGGKRKHGQESPDQVYSNKSRNRPSVEARVDPTYGQRSAIPGLDDDTNFDGEDGEFNYDEDIDALIYLRSVRREATGIPNLLVAPKTPPQSDSREIYGDGVGDYRGCYEDGAFYAAPDSDISVVEDREADQDPQLMYFDAILSRFEKLRAQLQQTPPPEAVQLLDQDHPTYLERLTLAKVKWWRWKMRTEDPLPAQIASMDKSTVLRLLTVLTGGALLKRGSEVENGVSIWAWSLLARLPERGELTSEEIGVVRELGKKAVLVGIGLKEEKSWEEGMQEVEAGYAEGGEEEIEDLGEAAGVDNEDEISLDDQGNSEFDEDIQLKTPPTEFDVSASSSEQQSAKNAIPKTKESEPEGTTETRNGCGNTEDEKASLDQEGLSAAKARILGLLSDPIPEPEINIEPEVITPKAPTPEPQAGRNLSRWNTKATVDMIITVAGEVYGQRDLLEFRGTWRDL